MKTLSLKSKKRILGFTLIEMLVAILIFSISFSSLLIIASRGIQNNRDNYALLRAEFLALEAIEIARNARDNYFLSAGGASWDVSIGGCPIGTDANQNTCGITYSPQFFAPCGSCAVTLGGSTTSFTRAIIFSRQSDDEVVVQVDVSWPRRGGTERTFTLQENLRLWR